MFLNQRERAKDAAVKEGSHVIQLGLASYAVDNMDTYPAAVADESVMVDGTGRPYIDNWPMNPWASTEMIDSGAKGDYTYTQLLGGGAFSLAGHMSVGDFVLP
jgi:hypothetical protein